MDAGVRAGVRDVGTVLAEGVPASQDDRSYVNLRDADVGVAFRDLSSALLLLARFVVGLIDAVASPRTDMSFMSG